MVNPYRPLIVLASCVLVVTALFFAKVVLVPIALSILLAFLLNPIVDALERRGFRPTLAAPLVVFSSLGILAGLILAVLLQVRSLVEVLPQYRENIRDKISTLRAVKEGPFSDLAQQTLVEIQGELEKTVEPEPTTSVPVRIENGTSPLGPLSRGIGYLASAGLVIVLVLFLLLQRRSLRDRLILLFGRRHLIVTTKALDEASARISRQLLLQTAVNAGYGVAVSIVLFALGVDYALLWGFFAAMLRFIPYLGPWLGAGMPILLSLAMFPGWSRPLLVMGAFCGLELTCNLVVEPRVYGRSAGVSEVAILITLAFWTWLWGPIGLILAMPLTVCIAVLGKHVPQLEFIALLLSDSTEAEPDVRFYQRLLARDEDEAVQIVEAMHATHSDDELPDALVLPALTALRRDTRQGVLDDEDAHAVLRGLAHVIEELPLPEPPVDGVEAAERPLVLGYPVIDELDRTGLMALGALVRRAGRCDFEPLGPDVLISELVEQVVETRPAAVCVGSLAPGGLSRAIHVCKRLRLQCPATRIVVGRWGGTAEHVERLQQAGAHGVCTTLRDTSDVLHGLAPLDTLEEQRDPARAPALSEKRAPRRSRA